MTAASVPLSSSLRQSPIGLSFSALLAFWRCPRLYHYRYLRQLPSLEVKAEQKQGNWVHQQLQQHGQGQACELAENQSYQALWQRYSEVISPFSGAQSWSEWQCWVPLSQFQLSPIWLQGQLDRLYLQGDSLTLFDWKTGSSGPGEQTHLQLSFYACLLWQAQALLSPQPLRQIKARAVWLETPDLQQELSLDARNFEATWQPWRELIEHFLEIRHFEVPAPRSVEGQLWCKMCEYQRLCPEGKEYAARHERPDLPV